MKETLADDDLVVNEDKTEETTINWLKDKNDEEWRKVNKLGSPLEYYEDIKRRIQLYSASFNTRKYGTTEKFISRKTYNYINLQSNQYYCIIQEPGDLQRKNKMKLMLLIVDN